jgi:hypothetical protein
MLVYERISYRERGGPAADPSVLTLSWGGGPARRGPAVEPGTQRAPRNHWPGAAPMLSLRARASSSMPRRIWSRRLPPRGSSRAGWIVIVQRARPPTRMALPGIRSARVRSASATGRVGSVARPDRKSTSAPVPGASTSPRIATTPPRRRWADAARTPARFGSRMVSRDRSRPARISLRTQPADRGERAPPMVIKSKPASARAIAPSSGAPRCAVTRTTPRPASRARRRCSAPTMAARGVEDRPSRWASRYASTVACQLSRATALIC